MADAKTTTWDTANALDDVLSRIKSLLHAATVLAEHDLEQDARLDLIFMAEELTEDAKKLATRLYKGCGGTTEIREEG